MVGSGASDRSKEAVGMMALHEALRSVCLSTDWTYSVFWTIRPRPMLMWEDGFCRGRSADCLEEMDGEDLLPPEWTDQFESGIQTIAVIQAGHGLLQLGSCKIIPEDLHFVLRMRHTFESLGYQSGFYLSQLFSSTRTSSPSAMPLKQPTMPIRTPPPLFNWRPRPMPSASSLLSSPNFQNSARLGIPQSKDESHMFLQLPHSSEPQMEDMMGGTADHENDIKWPNGLTFFSALTGRSDERILFTPDSLGIKPDGKTSNPNSDTSSLHNNGGANPNDFLSLDSHPDSVRKMDKFKRSYTLPARMASSSNSSTSLDQHQNNPGEYRNEGGMYPDVMERFLE
ncbi:hypothetical protein RND71_037892 [Anisodus tanguticus]|uniref:Transcription factor MYC/MYB N-terminal domain-containing protein n=1 Tax=Anisodus tanguticus TaxID=243964 RepID=A0AAE1QZG7_9SOLA|nr:hypothetical protein RND71_037892 [Anisodus tanguticus]